MATNEKPIYTGIDKVDHFNQREFQNTERERAMKMMLEEQLREEQLREAAEPVLENEVKVIKAASIGSTIALHSHGVAALLAAMAVENTSMNIARGKSSRGKPHDGKVKRSTLTREDFPSRQAWRAHQREQEKAERQGHLIW